MARVRAVTALRIAAGEMLSVSGSMSASTGRAPWYRIVSPVAAVYGVVITSSPRLTPTAASPRCSAAVHEFTAMACSALT
jgi:hypothetical protein